ncbi:uncharacterized protein LOC135352375 isoform X3 [Halichondria panicea]|uniref:uncharacterized protein LOC135352375 isoform X3 n=1 Tax=Halichondria panicea TaxID=6063 RepID=UPI00312B4BF6
MLKLQMRSRQVLAKNSWFFFPINTGQVVHIELFLFITNPESSAVNFRVTPINISGNVSNSSTSVNVPPSFEVLSVNERNKGILVEADGKVNVYGLSFEPYSADAYLALPCSKMAVDEYEYYGISYDIYIFPNVILFVACENETVVKFNSSTITLNSMETYQIASDHDLTGTRITSSKPLSVFSGSDCASVPQDINYCDHLVEQVPPTVTWGSKFLVASLDGRSSGERIRVLSARAASVAVNCNTNVSVSEFQLQSGGSFREFEIPINSFCSIESTSPVLVTQYAYGRESDGVGDPFMMIIPPIEQFTNNYVIEAFLLFRGSNYVTVYVSSEFFQTEQILLDNSIVTGWRNVVCSSGEICGHISRTSVSTGAHSIRHQNSSAILGVSVYGFDTTNSYGYPGGMRLSPIQCNCGQNSICLNNREQFNCSCLNEFVASLSETDEVVCTAITCPPLTAPTNGFVTYRCSTSDENGNYGFNAMANHSCDTGFVLVGNSTRTCTGDGSSTTGVFDGEAAICEPITCPPLTAPTNGSVTYSSTSDENGNFAFNAMANNSCDTGFFLVGNNTRTCTGDDSSATGVFDGEAFCKSITCPPLTAPTNGSVTYSSSTSDENGNYAFNAMANHSCYTGFVLVGNNTRTCTGDGSSTTGVFDGEAAICEPITCPPLTAPTNGSVTYSSSTSDENGNYAFNTMANHSCDTGFGLVGNNTRTCTGDGSSTTGVFDGEAAICKPITCPSLTAPTNGSVTDSSTSDENGNYAFNAMTNHSCDTGFVLVGNNTRTCTGDGSSTTGVFDGEAAICEPITCPPLTASTNGFVTYRCSTSDENGNYAFNAMASHSCNAGFVLVGNNTRTCTGDGSSTTGVFDGEAAICERVVQCEAEEDSVWGLVFPATVAGFLYSQQCPQNGNGITLGTATRFCTLGGVWEAVNIDNCTREVISSLNDRANELFSRNASQNNTSQNKVDNLLVSLAEATSVNATGDSTIFPQDLSTTNTIVKSSVNYLVQNVEIASPMSSLNLSEEVINILNNVLDKRNTEGWERLQMDSTAESQQLLLNAELYGQYVSLALRSEAVDTGNVTEITLERQNIVLAAIEVDTTSLDDIIFPEVVNLSEETGSAQTVIPAALLMERGALDGNVIAVNILFSNLEDFLPKTNLEMNTTRPVSQVISSQVFSNVKLTNSQAQATFNFTTQKFSE